MFICIPNSEKTEVKGTDKCFCKVHLTSSKRRKTPLLNLGCKFLLAQQKPQAKCLSALKHRALSLLSRAGSDTAIKQKNKHL